VYRRRHHYRYRHSPRDARGVRARAWQRLAFLGIATLASVVIAYLIISELNQPAAGVQVPIMAAIHVRPGEAHAPYNSNPPTSGPHYDEDVPWGVYDKPVAEEYWVHNLEHGGIVILYKCPDGCPDLVQKLGDLYRNYPKDKYNEVKFVITPSTKINNTLALAAWGWYDVMDVYDEARLRRFIEAHYNRGPEDVP